MEVHVNPRVVDGAVVLDVTGEVDLYTSPKLRAALEGLLADGHVRLLVNLLETSYLDTTALSVLNMGLQRARQSGGNLGLIFNQPHLDRMFSLTGLKEVFPIFDSEAKALAAVRSWAGAAPPR